MLLPGVLGAVALPMLSSGQENKVEFDKTMETSQSMATIGIVPAATVLLLLNGWIMALYGEEFAVAGPIFVSFVTGIAVSGIGNAAGSAIQAKGRMWLGAFMNLTWGLILLVFTAIFVSRWGGLALAVGFAVAYISLTAWGYVYLFCRNLVSKDMLIRVFGAALFVIAVALFSQVVPQDLVLIFLLPILGLSLWLSLWVLPAPFIRQRLFSALLRGEKHAT